MLLKCALVVLCFVCVRALEIGDACDADNNSPGTCKPINKCLYATLQIHHYQKPKMCRWKNGTKIVCCPVLETTWAVGELRAYFERTEKGILHGRDMTCRYKGEMPALCCEKAKDVPPPPETGCPALPALPPGIRPTDIAVQKCLEWRRYAQPCVADENDNDRLVRTSACHINQFADRIFNGIPADVGEFPHMALLGCRNTVDPNLSPVKWVAGGTLISEKFILAAGHVLDHRDYGEIQYVLLGAINKTEAREGRFYNIVNRIAHKLYEKNKKPYDIALLELDRSVEFSEFIRPACLPSPGLELESASRILAGWGQTNANKESEVLMKAYVAELDYDTECKPKWDPSYTGVYKKDSMICAGSISGDKADSCPGDSGGPLMAMARDLHCTYVVRGVVSFGPSCGSGPPGVYTDVAAYLPWIIENVWGK